MFDVVMFLENVWIMVYFGKFELRMEITLQLRFVFVHHYDRLFITSKLRYLHDQCFLMTLELCYIFGTFELCTEIT